jgi:hypothetical protein
MGVIMTFEEWYKSVYGVYPDEVVPNSYAYFQVQISRRAWEAARENLRSWDI